MKVKMIQNNFPKKDKCVLIGMRRLDHAPYISSVLKEFGKLNCKIDIAMDKKYFTSEEEVKKLFFERYDVRIERVLILSGLIPKKLKNFLGVLTYVLGDVRDRDYMLRHFKRSRFPAPLMKYIDELAKFDLGKMFLSKLVSICRATLYFSFSWRKFPKEYYLEDYSAVLITPGNMINGVEDDLLLLAGKRKIKSAVVAFSLDNLNSKGTVALKPDHYFAWNSHHLNLLSSRHLIPKGSCIEIGSPFMDKFAYSQGLSLTREREIRTQLGIPEFKKVVTYLGSSGNIHRNEQNYLSALLQNCPIFLEEAFLVIRPHPANFKIWSNWKHPQTIVWPEEETLLERNDTFEMELFHLSSYSIGLNTSAFLDAASCGNPVIALRTSESLFQSNASHFNFLINSGIPTADSLGEANEIFHSGGMDVEAFVTRTLPNLGNSGTSIAQIILRE